MSSDSLVLLVVNVVLISVALTLFSPIASLVLQWIAAFLPARTWPGSQALLRPKLAVMLLAEDAVVGLRETLSTLTPELTVRDQIIVIAKHPTADTVAIAEEYSAIVLENPDDYHLESSSTTSRRLIDGLALLSSNPPDVVAVVTTGTIVHPGALDHLSKLAILSGQPVQAKYLIIPTVTTNPHQFLFLFATLIKTWVQQRGAQHLGLPARLVGTGMAFPWSVMTQVSAKQAHLAPAQHLELHLLLAGYAPLFCEAATVSDLFPLMKTATYPLTQEWLHQQWQTWRTQVPRLMNAALHQKRPTLFALALNACIPSLSLLSLVWLLTLGCSTLLALLGASWLPTYGLLLEGLLLGLGLLGIWSKFRPAYLSERAIAALPTYFIDQIGVLWSALRHPPVNIQGSTQREKLPLQASIRK